MNARFEKKVLSDEVHTIAEKYKSLHNLPHWHMEYELVFVIEGSAELMVNNRFFEISQGSCAFINSEEIHYIKSDAESILGIIKTDAASIKKIAENKHLVNPILNEDFNTKQIFFNVYTELKNEKAFNDIITEAIITKFIAEIFRNKPSVPYTEPVKITATKYKELLKMLSTNYAHITFEEAAEYVNLNKSYFSRYFYRLSGVTFTRYLNLLKVSAAVDKIHEGKLNMTDISISCGFGTIRNFNRVFKKLTGYNPKSLPQKYLFIYNSMDSFDDDFDPTLNCTQLLK